MTFALIKMFENHKKNLGNRWVSIHSGGNIKKELKKQNIFIIIAYAAAAYEIFFNGSLTLALIYTILIVKDILLLAMYHNVLRNAFIEEEYLSA